MQGIVLGNKIAELAERNRNRKAMFLGFVALGLVSAAALSLAASQTRGIPAAIGIGGLIFVSTAAVGGMFGFLFSVPRILAKDPLSPLPDKEGRQPDEEGREGERKVNLLRSNSNLERISEWLTTMLVGVGLTQVGQIDDQLRAFSAFLRTETSHLGPAGATIPIIGPFVLLFGLVVGFIFFYLYTRLYLSALFQYVEQILGDREPDGTAKIGQGAEAVIEEAEQLSGESEDPSIKLVSGGAAPSVNQGLDIIRSLLYVRDGYQRAIDLGNKISGSSARSSAEYWLLMACAFGQKYHVLLTGPGSESPPAPERQKQLSETMNSVLTCVRNAVHLDPAYKPRLKALSNPGAYDNDLQDFNSDATFLALVS